MTRSGSWRVVSRGGARPSAPTLQPEGHGGELRAAAAAPHQPIERLRERSARPLIVALTRRSPRRAASLPCAAGPDRRLRAPRLRRRRRASRTRRVRGWTRVRRAPWPRSRSEQRDVREVVAHVTARVPRRAASARMRSNAASLLPTPCRTHSMPRLAARAATLRAAAGDQHHFHAGLQQPSRPVRRGCCTPCARRRRCSRGGRR